MNWRIIVPNVVSLAAMTSGLTSILSAANGHLTASAYWIMLAMMLDGLDGNLARWLNAVTDFGAELDSYVDLVAFGIAPAVLIYRYFPEHNILHLSLPLITVALGVIRLSRFKATDVFRGQKGYTGLPITISAGWTALFILLDQNGWIPPFLRAWTLPSFIAVLCFCLLLQISLLHYPKPTKNPAGLAVCTGLILALLFPNPGVSLTAVYTLLFLGLGYVLIGFFRLRKASPDQ